MNQGQEASRLEASDMLFDREYNEALVHQVLVAYQANARSGNRAQKDRQEVRHTTKKPWRQKGTGRARAGMSSSPIWRGGGRVFPSSSGRKFQPEAEPQDVPRRDGVDSLAVGPRRSSGGRREFSIEAPKTKLFAAKIKGMGYESVLVITEELDENVFLASRNLPNVLVVEVQQADPVSLVRFPKVLITKGALAKFEEILG
jgi:large subunit ribosomal protein L4